MPATFVVKTSGPGSLQQIQLGPADLVASIAAAHSAWGWIGGITGIQNLLKISHNPSEEKRLQQLFKEIELAPASCVILTQNGLVTIALAGDNGFWGKSELQTCWLDFVCSWPQSGTKNRNPSFHALLCR